MAFSWFNSRVNPIAIDLGTDSIKMLQLEPRESQLRLACAGLAEVPQEMRHDPVKRDAFAVEAIKKLISDLGFKGRQVMTCLPASMMAVQHLRVRKMGADDLEKALPFEAQGKLPFDPHKAMIKHMIAGEVYEEQEVKTEVILMAAARDGVDRHLAILSKAKLEVVGIHVEPVALIESFSHLFRRKEDADLSTMFIDIGAGNTHVVIAHGKQMVFAKHVVAGGDYINKKAAEAMGSSVAQAKELRIRSSVDRGNVESGKKMAAALDDTITAMVSDLMMCIRYYESIFPERHVDRIVFVGGESRHMALCREIAEKLELPALLGDPMARLFKDEKTKCGVEHGQPQPGWAVAVGLGMGIANN